MPTVFMLFVNELTISSNCSLVADDTPGICLSILSIRRYKFFFSMLNECETCYTVCFSMVGPLIAPINMEALMREYSNFFTHFLGMFAVENKNLKIPVKYNKSRQKHKKSVEKSSIVFPELPHIEFPNLTHLCVCVCVCVFFFQRVCHRDEVRISAKHFEPCKPNYSALS